MSWIKTDSIPPQLEVYEAAGEGGGKGRWRWRFRAGNGRIIADSAEGYVNEVDALNGFFLIEEACRSGAYEIQKGVGMEAAKDG